MCLQELYSLSKFAHVFELINGADKIEYWHQESLDYHDALNCKLEQVFLRELRSIEAYISADSFCQAEQSVDNLSCMVCELAGICTSDSVTEKKDCPHYSPTDLLKKLETSELCGRPRYYEARMYVLRNIQ
ncbi:unnamed protein product [Rotaria sp. Silwood1]|nr:unnamed protein product [Rotaria sp. Silwood1]